MLRKENMTNSDIELVLSLAKCLKAAETHETVLMYAEMISIIIDQYVEKEKE